MPDLPTQANPAPAAAASTTPEVLIDIDTSDDLITLESTVITVDNAAAGAATGQDSSPASSGIDSGIEVNEVNNDKSAVRRSSRIQGQPYPVYTPPARSYKRRPSPSGPPPSSTSSPPSTPSLSPPIRPYFLREKYKNPQKEAEVRAREEAEARRLGRQVIHEEDVYMTPVGSDNEEDQLHPEKRP